MANAERGAVGDAAAEIDVALQWLHRYYDKHSTQAQAVSRLETLVQRKLSELDCK